MIAWVAWTFGLICLNIVTRLILLANGEYPRKVSQGTETWALFVEICWVIWGIFSLFVG